MKKYIATGLLSLAANYLPPTNKPWKVDFVYNPSMQQIAEREAKINQLRPEFGKALIGQESGWNAKAKSNKGAYGCAQLTKYALNYFGLTKAQAMDCETSIAHGFRWIHAVGKKEIGSKSEFRLAQWYYCGINLYGKVIYDDEFKRTEVCGTSYATAIQRKSGGSAQEPAEFARLNSQIKREVKRSG